MQREAVSWETCFLPVARDVLAALADQYLLNISG
jgi:hypothetical protein